MNLLLFSAGDLVAEDLIGISVARYPGRAGAWPPPRGQRLRLGRMNGKTGEGVVERVSEDRVFIRFALNAEPPSPLPLTLVLALPRPKMLRRIVRSASELGVKQIHLVNASRVQKSYWQSPLLAQSALHHCMVAGLEQACDTVMPEVRLWQRFRPFVEDALPGIADGSRRLLAHPAAEHRLAAVQGRVTLAVGPEGGFTDFEVGLMSTAGFEAFSLGPRILRVETAVPVLAGYLSGGQYWSSG